MKRLATRLVGAARDLWLIVGLTIVLLLGLELAARVYSVLQHALTSSVAPVQQPERRSCYRAVSGSAPWASEYQQEHDVIVGAQWGSFGLLRSPPFSGEYFKVDSNGLRATVNATEQADASTRIFMFGGSTLFGVGSRDEQTIPSLVSKNLADRGYEGVHVVNFGRIAYVSAQELFQLMLELRDENVPDVVVFYDGVNDTLSATLNESPGLPLTERKVRTRYEGSSQAEQSTARQKILDWLRNHSHLADEVIRLRDRLMAVDEPPGPTGESIPSPADPRLGQTAGELASLPQRIVDIYASNLRMAEALSREYGFKTLFFWQPTLFSKRVHSDAESQVVEACPEYRELRPVYAAVHSTIDDRHGMPTRFFDLQGVFGDRESTYFLDFCHLNEDGNQIVAEAITQALIRSVSLDRAH